MDVRIILLSSSLLILLATAERQFVYVNEHLDWNGAQTYCREKYTDLVTVYDDQENQNLIALAQNVNECIWMGVYYKFNNWRWSMGVPTRSLDENDEIWAGSQPDDSTGHQNCARMSSYFGALGDIGCSTNYFFICFDGSDVKKYIIVPLIKTWRDAQTYCRTHHDDLASVSSIEVGQELLHMMKTIEFGPVGEAWIGLYRDSWNIWSDNGSSSFHNWETAPPFYSTNDHCGCLSVTTGKWNEDFCSTSKPFFCYGGKTRKQTVLKMKLQSEMDLSSREIQHQILQQMTNRLGDMGEANFTMTWRSTRREPNS